MAKLLEIRNLYLAIALMCAALLGYALFAQYVQHYEPCILCMVQRIFMCALGLTCFAAVIHNPKSWGWRVYGFIAATWATLGAYIAGRHVWLQSLPPEQLEGCAPSFEYILQNYSALKLLRQFFIRDQDCGKIDWTFLGISMPAWVLVWFIAMGLLVLWRCLSHKPKP